jgi:hypothetical protein
VHPQEIFSTDVAAVANLTAIVRKSLLAVRGEHWSVGAQPGSSFSALSSNAFLRKVSRGSTGDASLRSA